MPSYKVKFLRYGYMSRGSWFPARWQTIDVPAASPQAAIKWAKAQ